jgi:NNP family nitrate/nitrite transporter-like MFS transporter
MMRQSDGREGRQLVLATGALVACFAIFGSVAGMMPAMQERLHLNDVQVGLVLAMPVLIGSIGRIPVGMLADRFGGRAVYLLVMVSSLLPAFLFGWAREYWEVLACACLAGVPLALYPVGVAFISAWYPSHCHGRAIGMLTLGSLGHSVALFGAPLIVGILGYRWGFWIAGCALAVSLTAFAVWGEDAPAPQYPSMLAKLLHPMTRRMTWILSLFYFLTFGCFLSLSAFLPQFLVTSFHLSKADAGLRAAGFVTLMTISRPLGGVLADRFGGRRILLVAFPFIAAASLLMTLQQMVPFTIGALAVASAVGFGSGAILKLLPQYFPDTVGSVTGIVGAVGALGGFFPPIILGACRTLTGSFALAYICLSLFAIGCAVICAATIAPQARVGETTDLRSRRRSDVSRWRANLAFCADAREPQ